MPNQASFTFELGAMEARIGILDEKLHLGITASVEEVALFGVGYAKTTAPWTDDTGAARAGLHANITVEDKRWEIVFAHAVSYGIWLEIANHGRYQIIMPTVRMAMERLGHHLNGLMNELRGR